MKYIHIFCHGSTAAVGQGLAEVPHTPSDTQHSVGLLWTRDWPLTETSTCQHTILTIDRHPCPRRYLNPQFQQVSIFIYEWMKNCIGGPVLTTLLF
jgi:hypothetical protein